ncbi:uncharacterized protein BJ212DRAFT_1588579 [Suillus subaureus]|uniref:Protein CPL1-like domain-containing protein n=1 Tax=Suillus subaureus TaxID=48587 RepID=A0A9P7E7I1_9AGAM|nr:uncharacterized protein BJ212DRAFT_1588579 [Suillus subaureus]KAG1813531.1 hypothetical protein BJ212DRAFT_1588579 [Suillus subaureus]
MSIYYAATLDVIGASEANGNCHRILTGAPLCQDVCGSLNTDLTLKEVLDSQGKATVAGHLDVCLCAKDVVTFVKSNVVAQKAVKLVGDHTKVETLISNMITSLPTASHCSYPDHASPVCSDSNPCNFECTDGYLPFPAERPTSCQCPDHLMECGGKCGHFKECPSEAPLSRRNNDPKCANGLTMCGVTTSTGQPWKCVDVKTDATTCGACVKAAPYGKAPINGVNCKEIEGVIPGTVTCGNGRCIVKDCAEGFSVSPASDTCIPVSKYAPTAPKQQNGAAIPSPSGSTKGPKVSRDERPAGSKHDAGAPPTPFGGLRFPRDVAGNIQQGASAVVGPVVDVAEHLTASGSAGPGGVVTNVKQGAEVVSPVLGVVEHTSGSFKATRGVGLPHGAGVSPNDVAKGVAAGHMGTPVGFHGVRGVAGGLIPGPGPHAGPHTEDVKL